MATSTNYGDVDNTEVRVIQELVHDEVQEVALIHDNRSRNSRLVADYRQNGSSVSAMNCSLIRTSKGSHVLLIPDYMVFEVIDRRVGHVEKDDLDVEWFGSWQLGVLDVFYFSLRHDKNINSFVTDILTLKSTDHLAEVYDLDHLEDFKTLSIKIFLKEEAGTHGE
jgi:hypothetical protein